MWRQIRGRGFAYSYSMDARLEQGVLYFKLSNATHLAKAYKAATDIVVCTLYFVFCYKRAGCRVFRYLPLLHS